MMDLLSHNLGLPEPPFEAQISRQYPSGVPDSFMRRGSALFRTGDACDRFYQLSEGVVRVQAVSRAGREIVLYRVRPDELCLMTALGLMDGSAYMADGIAETDVKMHIISKSAFEQRLSGDPAFRSMVLGALSHRMRDVVRLLQDVAFEGVNRRLAQLLLERRDGRSMVCDTHEVLALELGSAREVVSRRLKAFERNGWVRLSRGRLDVVDADALRRVCV